MLAGDVMTGRGVDQILPHPGDPRLWESYVRDARVYVDMAESRNGPIPQPVGFGWPWGDALEVLAEAAPDLWLANLETTVTDSDDVAPDKAVNYRMHPDNVGCLTALRGSTCAASRTTTSSTSASPGCWTRWTGWRTPGSRPWPGGTPSRRADDLVVVSVHWGGNWGYAVSRAEREFAHRLVDGGVAVVHGHSAHHPGRWGPTTAGSSSTAAATLSTTTRASAGTRSTGPTCGCSTWSTSSREAAGSGSGGVADLTERRGAPCF